jgi:hypothetical protein
MAQTELEQLMATPNVIESICQWNAARYDQEYDHDLTMRLIREEHQEGLAAFESGDMVELADAYGDRFYVAIGGLWKMGLSATDIVELMDYLTPLGAPAAAIAINWASSDGRPATIAFVALNAFESLAALLQGDSDAALDVIRAICISNDTKDAKKTASNVKANTTKGIGYVPPTKAIEAILIRKGVI